jgi:hypothetical protein
MEIGPNRVYLNYQFLEYIPYVFLIYSAGNHGLLKNIDEHRFIYIFVCLFHIYRFQKMER